MGVTYCFCNDTRRPDARQQKNSGKQQERAAATTEVSVQPNRDREGSDRSRSSRGNGDIAAAEPSGDRTSNIHAPHLTRPLLHRRVAPPRAAEVPMSLCSI